MTADVNIADGKRTFVVPIAWYRVDSEFEQAVQFQPGYNGVPNADPRKDYGVHGMEITFWLRGPNGATFLILFTDWIPGPIYPGHGMSPDGTCSHVRMSIVTGRYEQMYPRGAELGYHAPIPQYDGQDPLSSDCLVLAGGECYYDSTYCGADQLCPEFVREGDRVIWAELLRRYQELKT